VYEISDSNSTAGSFFAAQRIEERYLWSERLCVCLSVRHTHESRL